MFAFAHLWVFVLLPLPWLLRWILPIRRVTSVSVRVPFGERLSRVTRAADSGITTSRGLVVPAILWILLLAALARPQWMLPPLTQEQPTRDLLLLVDLSTSMNQEDFTNAAGKKVDRLTAVKEVLGDFLTRRKGDRVGLVVFGDSPFLQAPFSTDLELSRQLLDETRVGMAGPRTAFGDAIGLGIGLFDSSDAPAKTMIVLTDGNDTASQVPPVEAARVAAQRDIRIHTVAIGDPSTVGEDKLDAASLQDTAEVTNGKYFFAADRKSLEGIYDELDRIETHDINTVSYRPRIDLFPAFVLLALLIALTEKGLRIWKETRSYRADVSTTGTVRVNPMTGKLEVSS